MNSKTLTLDFTGIKTLNDMHLMLKEKFGFPDFYGENVNALIDCLSSLRRPEDGMSEFVLDAIDAVLVIKLKNFSTRDEIIVNHFLTAIKAVNERDRYYKDTPSIYLLL